MCSSFLDARLEGLPTAAETRYGSARSDLIQLWHAAQNLKAVAAKGSALTDLERLALRKRFRCDGDLTTQTLEDACVCGPPNLGYMYG